jgi:hypothetical protein
MPSADIQVGDTDSRMFILGNDWNKNDEMMKWWWMIDDNTIESNKEKSQQTDHQGRACWCIMVILLGVDSEDVPRFIGG